MKAKLDGHILKGWQSLPPAEIYCIAGNIPINTRYKKNTPSVFKERMFF